MRSTAEEGYELIAAFRARTTELRTVWRDDLGRRFEEEIACEIERLMRALLQALTHIAETSDSLHRRVDSIE
jgi:uncharacterized protein YukE